MLMKLLPLLAFIIIFSVTTFTVSCRKDVPIAEPTPLSEPVIYPDEMVIGDYANTLIWLSNYTINFPNNIGFLVDSLEINKGFYVSLENNNYGLMGVHPICHIYRWSGYVNFGFEPNYTDTTYRYTTVSIVNSDPVIRSQKDYFFCHDQDTILTTWELNKKQRICEPGETIKRNEDWSNSTITLYHDKPFDMLNQTHFTADTTFKYYYHSDKTCWNVTFGDTSYIPFKTNSNEFHNGKLGWIAVTLPDITQLIIHELVLQN